MAPNWITTRAVIKGTSRLRALAPKSRKDKTNAGNIYPAPEQVQFDTLEWRDKHRRNFILRYRDPSLSISWHEFRRGFKLRPSTIDRFLT